MSPVAYLYGKYPFSNEVINEIYTKLSMFAGADFVAVHYTEKCLNRAIGFRSVAKGKFAHLADPLYWMKEQIEHWQTMPNPIQVAVRATAGEDPFGRNPKSN